METSNVCFACAGGLDNADEIVCNGFCRSSFHLKCVRQTAETRDVIKSSLQLFWMCNACTKMMSNACFRQSITSTNLAMQQMCEEQNKTLQELRTEIKQNTEKINTILHQHPATVNRHEGLVQSTRKRRRLHERDDGASVGTNESIGTKPVEPDVIVPLASSRKTDNKFWLYLSGFAPQATTDEISELVRKNLNTDEAVEVSKLVPRGRNLVELTFVSFKVGIGMQFKHLALCGSTWQKGITFREFDFNHPRTFRPAAAGDDTV